MEITKVVRTSRGSICLYNREIGKKIEFIARGCGEFNEGEVVVVLGCVHDTKPDEPGRGAKFMRVKRFDQAIWRRRV